MARGVSQVMRALPSGLTGLVRHPGFALLLPAIMVCAYLVWGETGLTAAALSLTVALALVSTLGARLGTRPEPTANPVGRDGLVGQLTAHLSVDGRVTATMVLGLDDADDLAERLGHRGMQTVMDRLRDRGGSALRAQDTIVALDDSTLAIALAPAPRFDLETLLRLAGRLQTVMADPVLVDSASVYVSVSIGFAASDRPHSKGADALLDAAEAAMIEARRNGPGSIRAYSREMHRIKIARHALMEEARDALELGQLLPWFQPQLSTDTGEISGFEALARWQHPERGTISPQEFLPAMEKAGLMDRLGEVMLYHAFTAVRAWDRAGMAVPTVGVNFSAVELRNPALLDKVSWELDRFGLSPDRLTVEVLESVVASADDDMTQRNIAGLGALGCQIDLDDFGTGHASITNLRRLSVSRIKIDRSFVAKVDKDRDQQRMVSAILTMAEQLDLDTLAEGVETGGEHAMLAQLGCRHVQGYGLGRPMPFAATLDWLHAHRAKLARTPQIGRAEKG
ncbi:MAG: bifunctional diguanylate cyclase/phosphodiesterase [Pseudomonadota bacterium]